MTDSSLTRPSYSDRINLANADKATTAALVKKQTAKEKREAATEKKKAAAVARQHEALTLELAELRSLVTPPPPARGRGGRRAKRTRSVCTLLRLTPFPHNKFLCRRTKRKRTH
jgi:hypothetical protein